jgi:hypothetical protein
MGILRVFDEDVGDVRVFGSVEDVGCVELVLMMLGWGCCEFGVLGMLEIRN